MEREFTVLSALSRHGSVPVPAPLAFCKDPSVVGTPFYVMQHVAGRIFLDQALPDMRPGERREAYGEMARALAALHSFRPAEVGLGGFGKGENYAARCGVPSFISQGQRSAELASRCSPTRAR